MSLAFFIAKRIHFSKDGDQGKGSPPAIRLAQAGIAIGLAVMILSVAIVIGFKEEIRAKVIGFGAHIQITNFDSNTTFETSPIAVNDSLIDLLYRHSEIKHIERYATKPGILKTDSAFMAIVLKGVGLEFDWTFFKSNLVEGELPAMADSVTSNQVLISRFIANRMMLDVGDSFLSYFVQDNVRARKFTITGIYQTNFAEYDKLFLLGDIRHVQKLNDWDSDQVSGIELLVRNYNRLDQTADSLYFQLFEQRDSHGATYYARSVKELNPQIFAWLDLLDVNVWVILILMSIVASFTMISGLLIIILERTNMIGVLKALGYSNTGIRKIFLYVSLFLIGKGLIWGNLIGVGFCLIQKYFQIVKLDPATYYISSVPIEMNYLYILLLNVATVVISITILIGPSYVVAKITPAKSIKFE